MIALLFLIVLAFGVILAVVLGSLYGDMKQLRFELRMLAGKVDQLERDAHPAPAITKPVQEIAVEPRVPFVTPPRPPVTETPQPRPVPATPILHGSPQPTTPTRTRAEWEALIGGKFLNRIGALALIIGMGFFLKYAFDRNWISEWVRVCIGFGAGAALLAGGARFHRKGLAIFAQGLIGAGIAILYLSVFASFNFYHLVSQPVAFGLMAVVTVVTFAQAFSYDALAVSLLGWLGGFLTPFLLNTGEANPVGLFSYITMLDIGLIAVLLLRRKWGILAPLSLAATYLIYYLWYGDSAGGSDGFAAVFFLCLFWILFHGYDLVESLKFPGDISIRKTATGIVHLLLFYPGLYMVVDRYFPSWLAPATFILAALYGCSAYLVSRNTAASPMLIARHAVSGIVLLVIGTEIQLQDFVVIVGYVVEAVVFFWFGVKSAKKSLWIAGLSILFWACIVVSMTEKWSAFSDVSAFVVVWNLRSLAYLSIAGGAAIMLVVAKKGPDAIAEPVHTLLHIVWILFVFLWATLETSDYFSRLCVDTADAERTFLNFQRLLIMGALWVGLGTALFTSGQKFRTLPVAIGGFVLLVLGTIMVAMRGVAFDPVELLTPLLNIRVLVLLCAAVMLSVCLARELAGAAQGVFNGASQWGVRPVLWFRIMLVVVTLVLMSGEIRDFYEREIALRGSESDTVLSNLENLKQMFLSAGWLVYSIVLMVLGLLRRVHSLRIIAIILFGIAIVKIFFYDLSFLDTLYRIISFIGLGIILLTVSFLYQRYRSVILEESPQPRG